MRTYRQLVFLLFCFFSATFLWSQNYKVNLRTYGAKPNGKILQTDIINQAIKECADKGGGTVLFPAGTYLTGTIHLQSNVALHLEKGAIIQGTPDLNHYQPYVPTKEMGQYDNAENYRWNRALLLGVGVKNVMISGEGIIDGHHVFDPEGEENMRGPHTVLFGESGNITICGVTIEQAANYAVMAYEIENAVFSNMICKEGWDGIHIRGGKNIQIRNCEFYTGDDAIAGGYWKNMIITDCYFNSSCNGIRMIMPATDLTIAHCSFRGDGVYPHRTSKELERKNMLTAVLLQPGGWGTAPGKMEQIHVHDLDIENVDTPFMLVLNKGNEGEDILVERINARQINYSASSIESWQGGRFRNVTLKDIQIEYIGKGKKEQTNVPLQPPHVDSRELPCWGFYGKNIDYLQTENVLLTYTGDENRPAFYLENVYQTRFEQTVCKKTENKESLSLLYSGVVEGELIENK